jgi:hypothetical protein
MPLVKTRCFLLGFEENPEAVVAILERGHVPSWRAMPPYAVRSSAASIL